MGCVLEIDFPFTS